MLNGRHGNRALRVPSLFRTVWMELFAEHRLQGCFHLCQPISIAQAVSQHKAVFAGVKEVNIWPVEPALPVRMHEMKQRVIHTSKKGYQLGCRRWRQTNVALWLARGWSWLEKKLMILQVGSEQSHTDSRGSQSRCIRTAVLWPLLVMPWAFKRCSASV